MVTFWYDTFMEVLGITLQGDVESYRDVSKMVNFFSEEMPLVVENKRWGDLSAEERIEALAKWALGDRSIIPDTGESMNRLWYHEDEEVQDWEATWTSSKDLKDNADCFGGVLVGECVHCHTTVYSTGVGKMRWSHAEGGPVWHICKECGAIWSPYNEYPEKCPYCGSSDISIHHVAHPGKIARIFVGLKR